ncbi:MAG: hypothetical protein V4594_18270 [Bacteroidota bacterium]
MTNKKAGKGDRFPVNIYRKKNNKAEVVFRSEKMLYRLGNVEGCAALDRQLKDAMTETGKTKLIEMRNSRKRRWVAEISSMGGKSAVMVWELMDNGVSILRFNWERL